MTAEIQKLLTELAKQENEYRDFEQAFHAEQQTRIKKIQELRQRLLRMTNQLVDSSVGELTKESSVDEPEVVDTKSGLLKHLYSKNPNMTSKEAAQALEGTDELAAVKRVYALRGYLVKTNQLQQEEDGSWTALWPD